jgi:hypothetical protein
MIGARAATLSAAALILLAASPPHALALPTMIRLGYSECASCHMSPQGGGPLNTYGRGIDRAQSLRGGEYTPAGDGLARTLTFGGRTTYDFRTIIQEQASVVEGGSVETRLWPRVAYRNVTEIGKGFRLSGTVTAETATAPRPELSYAPHSRASSVFLNTALLHYRASPTLEFAAGRDQLPSGVNVPDLGLWTRSRNRLGYYDVPSQLKMFWTGRQVHLTPFVYAPGGNEASGDGERGAGTLAEVVFGQQRTVVGLSIVTGTSPIGDRRMTGGYARLGFGRWGILAEHDFTKRTQTSPAPVSFAQAASYGQLFWAAREWLVASASAERLRVDPPFEERLLAGKFELAARLASQATVGVSARVQRDQISGRRSTSVMLQAAFKTVH